MEKLENQLGYLVLKDDGAILKSGGELENDERSANILMELLHLAESVDENFMPSSSCERISIVYEDHCYNICMSDRCIYIVKQSLRGSSGSNADEDDIMVYADSDDTGTSSTVMA